ncbi:hypothetical protein AEA09_10955 [Lysinibacillus contaminans]|uniref:DUF4179 domain-containing protein n=1 Tax=Lysinibacillus contaminans TaxID=1293441 RepID=A0ABR5K2C8_9BACI|nr:DUF1206 domain-containing protein [Lysinibacillus contaminans]KOS69011.1 hypothetical protein AEA09_10955 [Lysinibacillus contaminans]
MSDFKRQLDDIKIPENLHQRSLQGIQQAQKEQRKPRNWLPKVVAMVVTFAAIGFIALSVGEREEQQQQASDFMGKSPFSPQFYWLIAIVLMVVSIIVIRRAIKKGMHQKFGIASCVMLVLMLGNSALFLQNQLTKPVTVPLVHDFFGGNVAHALEIRYIINKNDHRSVRYLQAGELTLQALHRDELQKEDVFYYPTDTSDEGSYQLIRSAFFQGNTEEMQVLIDSDEVFLVLDDGEKLPTTLQIDFDFHYGPILKEDTYMPESNIEGNMGRTGVMERDVVLDEVYIPKMLEGSLAFEKMVVDKVTYLKSDFPIVVKKGQQVTLYFTGDKAPIDVNTMVGVRGPNGLFPIRIYGKADMGVTKLREELLRHDGV